MRTTTISLDDMEFKCRTISSGMTWVVMLSAEVEISQSRDGSEVDIEYVDYSKMTFFPLSKYHDDDCCAFESSFEAFDSLYKMFLKEDVDKIKDKVEREALHRLANE